MKKIVSLAIIILISIITFAQKNGPVISWEKTSFTSTLTITGIVTSKTEIE